jgi:predicted hotdog family 3-hydroxylacyl-ACP dehydratase
MTVADLPPAPIRGTTALLPHTTALLLLAAVTLLVHTTLLLTQTAALAHGSR